MKTRDRAALSHTLAIFGTFLCLFLPSSPYAREPQGQGDSALKGKFLVAEGTMGDPRFEKSVIYMIEHNDQGAMGFIINKILGDMSGEELARRLGIGDTPERFELRVHFGGPVGLNQLFLLHSIDSQRGTKGGKRIDKYVALSTDPVILRSFVRGEGPEKMRLIQGYAGWAPGQLESELSRGDWRVMEAEPSQLFSDQIEKLWEELMEETVFRL